jgi:hypothetical protein
MWQLIFYPTILFLFRGIFHTNRQLCSAEIEYNLDNYLEHDVFIIKQQLFAKTS